MTRLTSVGKVHNPDFGYLNDGLLGDVAAVWLGRYYPLYDGAATLFDYGGCSGRSVALFEPKDASLPYAEYH